MLTSITAAGLTPMTMLICSAASIILGLVIAFVHTKTARYTKNFAITLVILPILVQAVMMIVNGNPGTGIAILGAFSLVRFRSIPGTSREIVSVFFAMAVGLATGTGFVWFAAILTVIISLLLLAFHRLTLFAPKSTSQTLRITLPEDVDYQEVFEPVFTQYGIQASLEQLRTKNMGSLFELTYNVQLPESIDRKQFINDLRIRNNNLAIVLFESKLEGGL